MTQRRIWSKYWMLRTEIDMGVFGLHVLQTFILLFSSFLLRISSSFCLLSVSLLVFITFNDVETLAASHTLIILPSVGQCESNLFSNSNPEAWA
jgi:hypothetical protein